MADAIRVTSMADGDAVHEDDIFYGIRGSGAGADRKVTAGNGLVPSLLNIGEGGSLDLTPYLGDVFVVVDSVDVAATPITVTGVLPEGNTVTFSNALASLDIAGTIVASMLSTDLLVATSNGTTFHSVTHADGHKSENLTIIPTPVSGGEVDLIGVRGDAIIGWTTFRADIFLNAALPLGKRLTVRNLSGGVFNLHEFMYAPDDFTVILDETAVDFQSDGTLMYRIS